MGAVLMGAAARHGSGLGVATALMAAITLGGCVDQMPEARVAPGDVRNAIARGQMSSPKAATVALVSVEGAPAAVEAQFRQSLSAEAASREIAITDEASARYILRGYLSAYPNDTGGIAVAYTYDVFDAATHRRQQRIADTLDVPAGGGDVWTAVTPTVVSSLTGRSADDLAVALAGTPEAQQAAAASRVATATAGSGVATTVNR